MTDDSFEQVEELTKVFNELQNKASSTGKPLTKSELALGHIIGSTDNVQQCKNVYDALKKAGYIKEK